MKTIIVAGGCFWGVQAYYKQLKGVIKTTVGYIDGNKMNPTYEEVCSGITNHTEACEITYNSNVISLREICDHLFRISNPFSKFRQGNDVGKQYRTGIYYNNTEDKNIIDNFMKEYFLDDIGKVRTEVKESKDYSLAENYHQDYLDKNPYGYCHVDLGLASNEEKK